MDFSNELLIQLAWFGAAILFIIILWLIYSKVTRGSNEAKILAAADHVIIVPGYGMALAQAQHKVWELARTLQAKGARVSFAINPVAGRMPGHMDVLLADAGVPYSAIYALEEINEQFPACDVALVIGANDTVNPAVHTGTSNPVYSMPVLDAGKARQVFVIKRGQGTGFSGIENPLFSQDNTRMLYGDAREVVQGLIADLKSL